MKRDQEKALSDEMLQRYHDDELSAAERTHVEANLDGDGRARLTALSELHELLGAHHALETDRVDLSSTIDAIERSAPVAVAAPAPERRRLLPVSVLGVLAAAAACMFMFFGRGTAGMQSNEAEIESLEVEGGAATVLRMQDDSDPAQTTTVIWASLDDNDEDEDDDDDDDDDATPPDPRGEQPGDSDEKETL